MSFVRIHCYYHLHVVLMNATRDASMTVKVHNNSARNQGVARAIKLEPRFTLKQMQPLLSVGSYRKTVCT